MKEREEKTLFDVIIVGGGITGAGTARDCAMRGLKTLLLERFDISTGATGRNHGLLHSGARYAVTDQESAKECIKENMILRRIARHCVEETGGLFITLPEDDLKYQDVFVESCLNAGIPAEKIDPKEALRLEPSANPDLIGAVKVPDGAIDPFRLTTANIIDARRHGAVVKTYTKVTGLLREKDRIVGVETVNTKSGEKVRFEGKLVINAGGIWGHEIAKLAGITINMFPAKGALLIFGHRVNNIVINRCRKPGDADILVPGDTICLIGTTSTRVPYDEVDRMEVTPSEVDILLREGEKLAPSLAYTRIIRAYAGVRPLVASDDDPSGRSISRGIVVLDHGKRDGIEGIVTITGGKLMTYRLMAEWVTDMACKKLGVNKPCETAVKPLPGSEENIIEKDGILSIRERALMGRHGTLSADIEVKDSFDNALVCECEQVTTKEIKYAIENLQATNLVDLRRRTRMGMGTCQGQLCAARSAGLLSKYCKDKRDTLEELGNFLNERWHGMYPVGWGETLPEIQLTNWLYNGVCGLDNYMNRNSNKQEPEAV